MLISKSVKIKPVRESYTHFKNLGYDIKYRQEIEVPIEHLREGSSVKVEVRCEGGCEKNYLVEYRSYIHSINYGYLKEYCCKSCSSKISFNVENNPIFRNECVEKKERTRKLTCLNKYGVDCVLKDDKVQNKIKKNRIEKYGTEIIGNIPGVQNKIRKSKELNGKMIPLELKNDWEIYKLECHRLTKREKKELLDKWNGYDFYDNEYIRENFKLLYNDKRYPTIDHIVPKIYGYLNKIPAIEICKLENLCITKRQLNCSKKSINCEEFLILQGLK